MANHPFTHEVLTLRNATDTECAPLLDPESLLAWRPPVDFDINVASPWEAARERPSPRVLACHDLRGNYGEDRLIQGAHDPCFYQLTRWGSIDTFVYFAHHLVTVPPVGWINAAHANGTKVLGTFITEWDAGKEACEFLFDNRERATRAAAQLARIAAHIGFEGWLINIENDLSERSLRNLLHFLRVLRSEMTQHSMLVWYDAVTIEGKLEWQNTLNSLNRPFFDVCDAIFINYSWNAFTPEETRSRAGQRCADVFLGVDVFGRHSFAGGRMNSHIAVEAAHNAGLSSALFAISWPFEMSSRAGDATNHWMARDGEFWDSITYEKAPQMRLPFYSNFCPGSGNFLYQDGVRVANLGWYNLSMQAPMPACLQHCGAQLAEHPVFRGSKSLRIPACTTCSDRLLLFGAATHIGAEGIDVTVSYTYDSGTVSYGALVLLWETETGAMEEEKFPLPPLAISGAWGTSSCTLCVGSTESRFLGIYVEPSVVPFYLGCLGISTPGCSNIVFPARELTCGASGWEKSRGPSGILVDLLSVRLTWADGAIANKPRTARWHVWVLGPSGPVWLGAAHVPAFRVRKLPVSSEAVIFLVQAEAWNGRADLLSRCAHVRMFVPARM